jgi:hypothetical protein
MYTVKIKRKFFPGFKKFKVLSYKTESEIVLDGKSIPINPRMNLFMPDNTVHVIPDIANKEFIVDLKGVTNGSPEVRRGTGSST